MPQTGSENEPNEAPASGKRKKTASKKEQSPSERKFRILELVSSNALAGQATKFDDITRRPEFAAASKPTLNGDLKELQDMGFIDKVRTGFYSLKRPSNESIFEGKEYAERPLRVVKEMVAQACVRKKRNNGRFLLGGKFCFICHGTSMEPLFRSFRDCKREQRPQAVVTNSIPGLLELVGFEGLRLVSIGGTRDLEKGAFRPTGEAEPPSEDYPKWLGRMTFNVLLLSCSSLHPNGTIWCGDEMQEFRKALIDTAIKRQADIVILADRSKLGPAGAFEVETTIDWNKQTVWLFLDVPDDEKEAERLMQSDDNFKAFREKLKDRFVTVPVPDDAATQ